VASCIMLPQQLAAPGCKSDPLTRDPPTSGRRTDSRLRARLRAARTSPAFTTTSTTGRGTLSGTNSATTPVTPFNKPVAVPQRLGSNALSCKGPRIPSAASMGWSVSFMLHKQGLLTVGRCCPGGEGRGGGHLVVIIILGEVIISRSPDNTARCPTPAPGSCRSTAACPQRSLQRTWLRDAGVGASHWTARIPCVAGR